MAEEITPYPDNIEPFSDTSYVPRMVAGELHDGSWWNMFSITRMIKRRRVVAAGITAITRAEDLIRGVEDNGPAHLDLPGNPDMLEGGMMTERVEANTRQTGEEG